MSTETNNIPQHVAIIMDGNGRWAQNHDKDRLYGHTYGVESVREIVKAALEIGVKYLTIYAFSTENWGRPQTEVDGLMHLLATTIAQEIKPLAKQGVKLEFIGNAEVLTHDLQRQIELAKDEPITNVNLTLVIALNYSSRCELTNTTKKIASMVKQGQLNESQITEQLISSHLETAFIPDPELLIRTSGEVRLSNFLLWQLSYTELIFTEVLWPDFNRAEFLNAINIYLSRVRRFGKL